jgi:hypothetical protein
MRTLLASAGRILSVTVRTLTQWLLGNKVLRLWEQAMETENDYSRIEPTNKEHLGKQYLYQSVYQNGFWVLLITNSLKSM